jgi:hypothetical protein
MKVGKNALLSECMPIPKDCGGRGADPITTIAMMEGLGYGGSDQGLLFSINAHMWTNSIPLLKYGTTEQRKKYLPGLCDGSLIGANGASEPTAGSDIFSMQTRVRKDASDYVLNGRKIFVTNAPSRICSRCMPRSTRNSAPPVSVRSSSRNEPRDLASEKRNTRWDYGQHSWLNCCSRTAACQEQPC